MRMLGLEQVQLFWERSLDTKVLIGWSASTIVISIRGTASLRNAIADIQVRAALAMASMAATCQDPFCMAVRHPPRPCSRIVLTCLETYSQAGRSRPSTWRCAGCRPGEWRTLPSGGGGGWRRGPWCTAAST